MGHDVKLHRRSATPEAVQILRFHFLFFGLNEAVKFSGIFDVSQQ